MAESIFMKVSEVAKELGVSESYAYKLVRKLNKELEETGCSIGSKVHDKHSFYKLKSFITAVNTGTVDPGELDERRRKFLSNAKFRKQELEFLLILIERYVGFEKPNMLGKLYVAYIDGTINWNELAIADIK